MVAEIRIYVEGGGDGGDSKAKVRKGFSEFLRDLVEIAREKRIGWNVIACGSRNSTVDSFRTALRTHPGAFNVLLVDAEDSVSLSVRDHLHNRDNWDLTAASDEQCHLMAQVVEAWLIADLETLEKYYGQGFQSNSIPKTKNIEDVSKQRLYSSLSAATRLTKKGEYHKIRHGPEILAKVDSSKARGRARHCERFFATLEGKMST